MAIIIATLLFPFMVQASFIEFEGASAKLQSTMGLDHFESGADANVFGGSSAEKLASSQFSLNFISFMPNLSDFNGVITKNPVNSGETAESGHVKAPNTTQNIVAVHALMPIGQKGRSQLGLSFLAPVDKLMELSTTDPYAPDYPLIRGRHQRTQFVVNLIYALEKFRLSAGILSGLSSQGETYVVANDSGASSPSSGKIQFDARPEFSPILSAYIPLHQDHQIFLNYQGKNESKIENNAGGLTPVGAANTPYSWKMTSLIHFDPAIYRAHYRYMMTKKIKLFLGFEYQDWSGYKTSALELENTGGILVSSSNPENFETRNITIPKVAASFDFDKYQAFLGLSYRQSPLKIRTADSGNSLDLDRKVISLGASSPFYGNRIYLAFQQHELVKKSVTKSQGLETGGSGQKIGSPGYTASGSISSLALGLHFAID